MIPNEAKELFKDNKQILTFLAVCGVILIGIQIINTINQARLNRQNIVLNKYRLAAFKKGEGD